MLINSTLVKLYYNFNIILLITNFKINVYIYLNIKLNIRTPGS